MSAKNDMASRDTMEHLDWPTYWFARLEQAIREGNHEAANNARVELKRLGFDVRSIETGACG